jgi:hypothetical protein
MEKKRGEKVIKRKEKGPVSMILYDFLALIPMYHSSDKRPVIFHQQLVSYKGYFSPFISSLDIMRSTSNVR